MPTATPHDRLEALIDDLLLADDPETTSLASLLMTVQESLQNGSIVALSLLVRRALHDQQGAGRHPADSPPISRPLSF